MHKDYIMRIVEHFVKALAAIVSSRKAENYDEASEQIKMASRFYLQTDLSLLLYCPPEQLLEHFRTYTKEIDTEKCVLCADLLLEQAFVNEAKKYDEEALRLKISSLYLYVTGILKEKQFQVPEYLDKVSALLEELKDQTFPPDIQASVHSYLALIKTTTSQI